MPSLPCRGLLAVVLIAAMGMPSRWASAGGDPAKDGEDPGGGAEGPSFSSLRAIQYGYSPAGGDVFVEWEVEGGKFLWFLFSVDSASPDLFMGNTTGVKIEGLTPGYHEFILEGISLSSRDLRTVGLIVLTESPVEPVVPNGHLYFGYDPKTGLGFLQIAWQIPERSSSDPYVDFEIRMTTEQGDSIYWRTDAPDNAVTFSKIPQGTHSIEITGMTGSYASRGAGMDCRALGLLPPRDVRLVVYCDEGHALGAIHYEVPEGTRYDAVAVWSSDVEKRVFLGYFQPDPPLIVIDLPEKAVELELAGAMFDTDHEVPFAISNLPGRPGVHATVSDWINCTGRVEFRRGDADSSGGTDITDAIKIIAFLFLGDASLSCASAADVDDNENVEITDAVRLLAWLFTGGDPLPEPGPSRCGEDPTPGDLGRCDYETCGLNPS